MAATRRRNYSEQNNSGIKQSRRCYTKATSTQRGKAATEFVDARWYDEHDEDGGWSVEDGGG
jgi:hypothetical protein